MSSTKTLRRHANRRFVPQRVVGDQGAALEARAMAAAAFFAPVDAIPITALVTWSPFPLQSGRNYAADAGSTHVFVPSAWGGPGGRNFYLSAIATNSIVDVVNPGTPNPVGTNVVSINTTQQHSQTLDPPDDENIAPPLDFAISSGVTGARQYTLADTDVVPSGQPVILVETFSVVFAGNLLQVTAPGTTFGGFGTPGFTVSWEGPMSPQLLAVGANSTVVSLSHTSSDPNALTTSLETYTITVETPMVLAPVVDAAGNPVATATWNVQYDSTLGTTIGGRTEGGDSLEINMHYDMYYRA